MTHIDGYWASEFQPVIDVFAANFEQRDDVGAAFCVCQDGEVVVNLVGGLADATTGRLWADDTIAPGFSMTKGVTAVCANLLIQDGHLDPDAPVARYWPEFAANGKAAITVAQLLSHQAGLPVIEGGFTLDTALAWDPVVDALAAQAPLWEPGTAHGYHLRSFGWLAGEVIRRADPDHRTVAQLVRDIAGPLALDLWIGLPEELESRVARLVPPPEAAFAKIPRESDTWKAMTGPDGLFGYNDMWNTRRLHAAELPSSSGIGSAVGFARLYASLMDSYGFRGRRLLDAATIERAATALARGPDRIIVRDTAFGLGFMLPPSLPTRAGPRSFGHGGAGGSMAFADPDRNLACCYLMNSLQFDFVHPDMRAERLVRAVYNCLDVEKG